MTESEEETIRHYEELRRQGKELDNLVPVKARVSPDAGIVFSIRFSGDEFRKIEDKAKEKRMKVSAFIRTAALSAAVGDLDLKAGEHQSTVQDVRKKARELAKSVERLR
jgi:hypothetical protein